VRPALYCPTSSALHASSSFSGSARSCLPASLWRVVSAVLSAPPHIKAAASCAPAQLCFAGHHVCFNQLLRCGELVAAVLAAPPDASVVRLVDDISDEVSCCWGGAGWCGLCGAGWCGLCGAGAFWFVVGCAVQPRGEEGGPEQDTCCSGLLQQQRAAAAALAHATAMLPP
jgi:hypothetical protein